MGKYKFKNCDGMVTKFNCSIPIFVCVKFTSAWFAIVLTVLYICVYSKYPYCAKNIQKVKRFYGIHSEWFMTMPIFGSHTLVLYRAVLLLDLHNAHYMSDRKATAAATFVSNKQLIKDHFFPHILIAAYCILGCCCPNFDSNMEIICVKLRC